MGEFADLPPEETLDSLRRIGRIALKMNNIIDELLLLAGLREARVDVVSLDMATVVTEVVQRLAPFVKQYRAELVLPDMLTWLAALGYAPWIQEVWGSLLCGGSSKSWAGRSMWKARWAREVFLALPCPPRRLSRLTDGSECTVGGPVILRVAIPHPAVCQKPETFSAWPRGDEFATQQRPMNRARAGFSQRCWVARRLSAGGPSIRVVQPGAAAQLRAASETVLVVGRNPRFVLTQVTKSMLYLNPGR